jgi:hypothetical protein
MGYGNLFTSSPVILTPALPFLYHSDFIVVIIVGEIVMHCLGHLRLYSSLYYTRALRERTVESIEGGCLMVTNACSASCQSIVKLVREDYSEPDGILSRQGDIVSPSVPIPPHDHSIIANYLTDDSTCDVSNGL